MSNVQKSSRSVPLFLISVAAVIIIVAGMKTAQEIVVPMLLALFIAIITMPPLFWLKDKGIPKPAALLIVVAVVVAILFGVAAIIATSVTDFAQEDKIQGYQQAITQRTHELLDGLDDIGIDVPKDELMKYLDAGVAMRLAGQLLTQLGGLLSNAFLILLTVIFILFEASGFPNKLRAALRDPEEAVAKMNAITEKINRYIVIKTIISFATGVLISIWLSVVGVDYPLLWGLLAFLLNYVPNIGSILAAIPPVLLALIQPEGGLASACWTAGGYVVANVVIGNVVEPRLMGRGLGLSTLVVFISLVFWGWVLGLVGMLLSIPLTMTVKLVLEGNENTRWISVLLGSADEVEA